MEKQWREMKVAQAEFEKKSRDDLGKFGKDGVADSGFSQGGLVHTRDGS